MRERETTGTGRRILFQPVKRRVKDPMVVVLRVLDDSKEDLPDVLLELAHFFFLIHLDTLRRPAGLVHPTGA